ncbi:MAG: hypothetical protein V3573_05735 [Desulfovibrionaceae bacterium]
MRKIILSLACCAALALFAGCSVEQGGSEDPADFKTVQGLEQGVEPADEASPALAQPSALESLESRLASAEEENARLRAELDELRSALKQREAAVDQRLEALEKLLANAQHPSLATGNATKPTPLIDFSNDQEFEEKVVREGLEQILNMSRLLLDKMEYDLNNKNAAATPAEPAAESGAAVPAQ